MKNYLKLAAALLLFQSVAAQEKWDLRKCVDYALANNISVKGQDITARIAELTYKQSNADRIPSLNFGGNAGFRFGLAENPTTGVFENNNIFSSGVGLQSQVTLFNWFTQKNTVESNRITLEAEKEQVKKIQNDISLNVAVAYLQVLLAREQANIAKVQVEITRAQLNDTRKRVNAGSLPELNAAELEAQLARDSSSYISAEGSVQQFILQLKALLALDAAAPFDVATPPVDRIPLEALADLMPDVVYGSAMANLPQQKVNELRILAARKSAEAAKGRLYPSLGASGSLYSNYVSFKDVPIYNQVISGYTSSGLRANNGGTYYDVERPIIVNGNTVVSVVKPDAFGKQFKNNFGQGITLNLNVPIFNGKAARTGWERAKLNIRQLELMKQGGDLQLKQDIYKAYNDAMVAMQKYNADKIAVTTAERSYEYARKRYDLNLLSSFELITSQTNVQRARFQVLYSQYDYVFKMKLLEFYKGQGIKL